MDQEVKSIMAEVLEIPVSQIDERTTMETVDSWDSLRHMEMLVAIERHFNVEFEADEALEMTNVEGIKRILGSKLEQKG